MVAELKELRPEDAQYIIAINHKAKKSGSSTAEPGQESLQSEIDKAARCYQVFGSTVIDVAAFSLPRPIFSPTDPGRYKNDVKMILGTTSELYAFIPAEFHELIPTKKFAKDVSLFYDHFPISCLNISTVYGSNANWAIFCDSSNL